MVGTPTADASPTGLLFVKQASVLRLTAKADRINDEFHSRDLLKVSIAAAFHRVLAVRQQELG